MCTSSLGMYREKINPIRAEIITTVNEGERLHARKPINMKLEILLLKEKIRKSERKQPGEPTPD